MPSEQELRFSICGVGRRLSDLGLVGACEGNVTARIDAQRLLCTPSGVRKGELRPQDLIVIDLDGKPHGSGNPSSEVQLHLRCYAIRPDCMAVIHAHPPVATAFTVAGESIPDNVLPESGYVLGPVAMVPFGYPGTNEVADGLEPFLKDHKTFLLSHHGAVVLGSNLEEACDRMETLERVATVLMYAKSLGRCNPMPSPAYERLAKVALDGGFN